MGGKTCIASVAFRNPYVQHMDKLESFLKEDGGWVYLLFYKDKLPHKNGVHEQDIVTHFQESLYGFKPHAIQRAIDLGYKKIIWLDPSVLPTVSMKVLIDSLDHHPMIVRTGDQKILGMVNQKAKDWFRFDDSDLINVKHVGGTIYCFNFNDPKVVEVFNLWKEAEENGIFGNQDDFMAGHWADEACMSLAMHRVGVPQYYEEAFTYYNMKNGI